MTTIPMTTVEVGQAVENQMLIYETAERLLIRESEGEELTPMELLFFSTLGWDHEKLDQERSRMCSVGEHQRAAGSGEQFDKAKKKATSAQSALSNKRDELESKIAQLQEELTALESEHHSAQKAVVTMTNARSCLREPRIMPEHIRAKHTTLYRRASAMVRRDIAVVESKIRFIDRIQELDHERDRKRITTHFQSPQSLPHFPGSVFIGSDLSLAGADWMGSAFDRNGTFKLTAEDWKGYQEDVLKDRPALEQELDELRAKAKPLYDDVAKVLDRYIPDHDSAATVQRPNGQAST